MLEKLDNSEKDFLLVAFAFVLVALFLLITGVFDKEVEIEKKTYSNQNYDRLTELQIHACQAAESNQNCENLIVVSKNACCEMRERCCET